MSETVVQPECYQTPPCPLPPRSFKIEAVVVCENYSDFLRHTLPANKHLFDRIVVVTSYVDKKTQKICEYNHVECVKTDVTRSYLNQFCKGAAINAGLGHLSKSDWVVHLDADIALPPQTRILIERAHLQTDYLYGIDRFLVRGPKAWEEFQNTPKLQHEAASYIHLDAFPLGTRVMSEEAGGYIPIGFFQMWNPESSHVFHYPEGHTSAGREDMLFAKEWPRHRRGFIPEVVGYHLESEGASMSSNWNGRVSAPFTV